MERIPAMRQSEQPIAAQVAGIAAPLDRPFTRRDFLCYLHAQASTSNPQEVIEQLRAYWESSL